MKPCWIDESGRLPILRFAAQGNEYSFTVKDVAPEARDWLCSVLTSHVVTIVDRATKLEKKRIRTEIANALML